MPLMFSIAKNLIEEAVGFEMNNLITFPFSRLPNGLQLEIIEGLNVKDKMELYKVNSGPKGYFARNGPFGRHVDLIQVILFYSNVRRDASQNRFLLPDLKINQKKILFRKIHSCKQFFMKPTYGCRDKFLEDIDGKTTNYFADCFGNLRVVSELRASVTDWAELNLKHQNRTDFSEVADFLKSYLEKQLKNCKRVAIIGDFKLDLEQAAKVLEEIPGFQLEEDSNKTKEMIEALYKSDSTLVIPDRSKVKCCRRKIGDDEQRFILVALTMNDGGMPDVYDNYVDFFYDPSQDNRSIVGLGGLSS